jgi:maltose O-acetyltransferase
MPTEREKMMAGTLYSPADPALVAAHREAQLLCRLFNVSTEDELEQRRELLERLLGKLGEGAELKPPFRCDYGFNVRLGRQVFINYGAVFLDCNTITIGGYSKLGPGVHIYAADHPRDARERASGLELARPVWVGRHVWIGGGAILCPGVRIGDRSTIGAGSVVVSDIPADVVAAGNPCRVVRELEPWEEAP